MKKIIVSLVASILVSASAFAGLSTNDNGQIIDTYTNMQNEAFAVVVGYASDTVSPYLLTPNAANAELAVADGGTFVIDPVETAGAVTNNTLAAPSAHGLVLRLVILPATNTFVIAEGTTAQLSGGTVTPTGAGTNDMVELWSVGATWREANSATLVE